MPAALRCGSCHQLEIGGAEKLRAEKALLVKSENDIDRGRQRLRDQENLLLELRADGHQTQQAERLVEPATEDANRIREEANRTAHQLTTDARTRAERVQSEARVNAERLKAEVLGRAEKLDREIASRRGEMFGDLEKQRDDLTAAVGALRDFEAAYRANLTSHLRKQIETLESSRAEPVEVPDVVHDQRPAEHSSNGTGEQGDRGGGDPTGGSSSNTPRLDALRGDQR